MSVSYFASTSQLAEYGQQINISFLQFCIVFYVTLIFLILFGNPYGNIVFVCLYRCD
jgi:hypothetical protein